MLRFAKKLSKAYRHPTGHNLTALNRKGMLFCFLRSHVKGLPCHDKGSGCCRSLFQLSSQAPPVSVRYSGATTTSKAEPLTRRSSSCRFGILGSGATEMAHSIPLSATNIPYLFNPLRIACTAGEKSETS